MRLRLVSTCLFLALFLLCLPAAATTVLHLTLKAALEHSSDVVTGKVLATEAWRDSEGRIFTDTRVLVERALKGEREDGDEILLRHLGGVVEGLGMAVAGMPRFAEGERVLLFLEPTPDKEIFRSVGLFQGSYSIRERSEGSALAVQKPSGDAALARKVRSGGLPTHIVLDAFLKDIEGQLDR